MPGECIIYRSVKKPFGISQKDIRRVVQEAFASLHKKKSSSPGYLVSVHVVGERRIRRLNQMFRGIDAPTDVLSFAAQEGPVFPQGDVVDWGDVFVCPWYVRRQAKRFSVSYKEEFFRMLIHGILHLHGYDHIKEKDAARMFSLQESILEGVL